MNKQDYTDASKACYQLAMALGKDGYEQQELVIAIKQIEKDAKDDRLCLIGILGIFYDGLAYGNWPWTK